MQICSTISNSQPWNSPIIGSSSFLAVKSPKDREESQQNGVAVQRERDSSDLVCALKHQRYPPFHTSRGLPREKLQKFLIPYERENFKGTVAVWSLFQLSQSERKGNTRDRGLLTLTFTPTENFESAVNPTCGSRTHKSKVRICRLYRGHQSSRNIAQYVI